MENCCEKQPFCVEFSGSKQIKIQLSTGQSLSRGLPSFQTPLPLQMHSNSAAFKKISSTVYSTSQQMLFWSAGSVELPDSSTDNTRSSGHSLPGLNLWKLDLAGKGIVCWTMIICLKTAHLSIAQKLFVSRLQWANSQPHAPCPPVVFATCSLLESIFPGPPSCSTQCLPTTLPPSLKEKSLRWISHRLQSSSYSRALRLQLAFPLHFHSFPRACWVL